MTDPVARHCTPIQVRWGDLDALGHVNNTGFLRYIEEARIRWFERLGLELDDLDGGPVVVHIDCNFRRGIRYPADIEVCLHPRVASAKRLILEHLICDRQDSSVHYSDGCSTIVWVDRRSGRARNLPSLITDALGNPGPEQG